MTVAFNLASLLSSGGNIGGPLMLHGAPANALEAADKSYVDGKVSGIPDAPISTTVSYGRLNAAWTPVLAIAGGTLTGPLILNADPTVALGATTKQYVDGKIGSYLPLSGGALSGALTLYTDPAGPLQAATKQYVDNAPFLKLAGGTMTGPIVLPADPTVGLQAATKQYVDSHAAAGGLGDAPQDGTTYGRNNAAWVNVLKSTGGVLSGTLSGSGAGQTLDNFSIDMGTF